jgi:glycosyltransferase involved in cell wall biosynthesis
VIGHKLTVEGIVAREVARLLGIPFAITIQGNTDQKILDARRDLRGRFARIYHEAACVFSFAPWARAAVEQRLGKRDARTLDLPCPTMLDQIRPPAPGGNALISVFHLRNHAIKNLAGLARAMRALGTEGCPATLQVIGGGSAAETAACAALIAKTPNITLTGPQSPDALGPTMNKAIALVMPSKRESFGLVFVEALFAGLPIIYPKGAGVDGYFDGLPFAIAVDPRNPRALAAALRHAITEEAAIKHALARWQEDGGLTRFTRDAIGAVFDQGLQAAILSAGPPTPAG